MCILLTVHSYGSVMMLISTHIFDYFTGSSKCDDKGRRKLDFCPDVRPLEDKKVFLDIGNHARLSEMVKRIESLGGVSCFIIKMLNAHAEHRDLPFTPDFTF